MKRRVLLWGTISSPWTVNFVQKFLLSHSYEVYMLKRNVTNMYLDEFMNDRIHLIEIPQKVTKWYESGKKGSPLKTIYMHYMQIKAIFEEGKYDIIHLQYVGWYDLIIPIILKIFSKSKLLISYWGSDLLATNQKILKRVGWILPSVDYATFDNEDLRIKFQDTYPQLDRIKRKTALFGLPILDEIEKKKTEEVCDIKKKLLLPTEKKIIAIGYNGRPRQQHLEVLEIIKKLDWEKREKLFLLLQMSYGGNDEYVSKVRMMAQETGCEFKIVEDYLTDEEVADLRIATDIYINAQTTDAFSGSVCENMYAGTLIINAAWLRYKEFDMYNFKVLEFDKFENLGKCILEGLEHKMNLSENKELIWKLRSWESCSKNWERVYREVLDS